jgi:hypothetical protein
MAIYFKKPDKSRDWRVIVDRLSQAGLFALALDPGATWEKIRGAITDSEPTQGIDERAWTWLQVSLTVALFDLLNDPTLRAELNTDEKKQAARDFLDLALSLQPNDTLDLAMLTNPVIARPFVPVRDKLPDFARQAAPGHGLGDDALRTRFDRIL